MDYKKAIQERHSQRRYTDQAIDASLIAVLEHRIATYNQEAGLHIQLVLNEAEVFNKFKTSYGIFKGVKHYIALVGKKSDQDRMEKEGRYGELLVLEATSMGLSTCWLGTSYDKSACGCKIEEDEVLDLVIAIGYGTEKASFREKMMYRMMHKNEKGLDTIFTHKGEVPSWVMDGMQMVLLAPTARNLRPFLFHYQDGIVSIECTGNTERVMVDIGIVKLHFELGADCGHFEVGAPARFLLES